MTGAEVAVATLYVVFTFGVLIVGMILGAFFMAAHVGTAIRRAQDEVARKLLAPPPLSGDEWKKKDSITDIPESEDEKWLRRRLEDDNPEDEK